MVPKIHICQLPYEIVVKIFEYSGPSHITGGLSQTCSKFRSISMDQSLWLPIVQPFFWTMGLQFSPQDSPTYSWRDYYFDQFKIDGQVTRLVNELVNLNPDSAEHLDLVRRGVQLGNRALVQLFRLAYGKLDRTKRNLAHMYESRELYGLIVRLRAYHTLKPLLSNIEPNAASQHLTVESNIHRPRLISRQSSQQLISETRSETFQTLIDDDAGFFSSPMASDTDHHDEVAENSSSDSDDLFIDLQDKNEISDKSSSRAKIFLQFTVSCIELTTGEVYRRFYGYHDLTKLAKTVLQQFGSSSPSQICDAITRILNIHRDTIAMPLEKFAWIEWYARASLYTLLCQKCGLEASVYVDGTRPQVMVQDRTMPLGHFWVDICHTSVWPYILQQPVGSHSPSSIANHLHRPFDRLCHEIISRFSLRGIGLRTAQGQYFSKTLLKLVHPTNREKFVAQLDTPLSSYIRAYSAVAELELETNYGNFDSLPYRIGNETCKTTLKDQDIFLGEFRQVRGHLCVPVATQLAPDGMRYYNVLLLHSFRDPVNTEVGSLFLSEDSLAIAQPTVPKLTQWLASQNPVHLARLGKHFAWFEEDPHVPCGAFLIPRNNKSANCHQ